MHLQIKQLTLSLHTNIQDKIKLKIHDSNLGVLNTLLTRYKDVTASIFDIAGDDWLSDSMRFNLVNELDQNPTYGFVDSGSLPTIWQNQIICQ